MFTPLVLVIAALPLYQGKEIGFLELEKLKWTAAKDIKQGFAEWEFVLPTENGEVQRVKVVYRTAGEKYYLMWSFEDQRYEMLMTDEESLVVNHTAQAFVKLDTKKFREFYGYKEGDEEQEYVPKVAEEDGTMHLHITHFQAYVIMNPVPQWVSTEAVELNKRKMTLVTHRVLREDGTLRCEVKQWFPEGSWIAEKVSALTVDSEGKKFNGEAAVKVMDLSARLKPSDITIKESSYKGYQTNMDEQQAFAMLMLLMGVRGQFQAR